MAQSFTTPSVTLYKPGAVVETRVQAPNSGLSTTGVLMLVGEADAGPDVLNDDITTNSFGPDALASVIAKYRSGPLVDAFRLAVQAANDPNIQGSFASAFLVKTNASAKSSGTLLRAGLSSNYGTIADRSYGEFGNLIQVQVSESVAEVAPTTGQFTYIPTPSTSTLGLRVNGQATQSLAIGAKTSPANLVGTVESAANQAFNSLTLSSLNNIHATGGVNRATIDAAMVASAQTLAVAASSNNIVITLNTGSWAVSPSVGDTLIIPANGEYGAGGNSAIKGAGDENYGSYVVTGVTSSTISATKLRNNAAGALIPPVTVGAIDIAAIYDFLCFSPITVQNFTGTERSVLTGLVGIEVTGTASGSTLTLTLQTGSVWAGLPQAGDLVLMPVTAPAAWRAAPANGGWYRVTSATSGVSAGASTIVMTRLSNGAPASFVATAIGAVTDLRVLRPAIDGKGKALELFDGGGTESVSSPGQFFNLSTTQVSWISAAGAAKILLSSSEFVAELTAARLSDSISESVVGNGEVVLRVGYHGGGATTITGSMTISGTTLTTTVTNGTGSNLTVDLKKFRTVSELAAFINAQTGYVASAGSALYGQVALNYVDAAGNAQVVLDKGTWGIASQLINNSATVSPAGRVKRDAYGLFKKLSENSVLVQLGTTNQLAATAGQPEVQSLFFLSGGTRGGTTNALVSSAFAELEKVRGNFLVPLFSRDATDDAADGLTDATSTYTVDGVNALAKTHVLAMSTIKRRRNRQAYLSKQDSFANVKLAANDIASARCSMTFQDMKAISGDAALTQYQPWLGAALAASMQAAGFYKPIVKKFINVSGVLMNDSSYSDQLLSDVESALQNGLLPAERAEVGGFRWVSDQTTYAVDNNFVYNSSQAVYVADVIALTLAQRMEDAFVGQSLADISAGVMLAYLTAVMSDFKKLKLIAASDDAPLGFRNASVKINGPAAVISLEVKLAGALYFIPITAYFTQVTQSASL